VSIAYREKGSILPLVSPRVFGNMEKKEARYKTVIAGSACPQPRQAALLSSTGHPSTECNPRGAIFKANLHSLLAYSHNHSSLCEGANTQSRNVKHLRGVSYIGPDRITTREITDEARQFLRPERPV
jgi:hypothetical protein